MKINKQIKDQNKIKNTPKKDLKNVYVLKKKINILNGVCSKH